MSATSAPNPGNVVRVAGASVAGALPVASRSAGVAATSVVGSGPRSAGDGDAVPTVSSTVVGAAVGVVAASESARSILPPPARLTPSAGPSDVSLASAADPPVPTTKTDSPGEVASKTYSLAVVRTREVGRTVGVPST